MNDWTDVIYIVGAFFIGLSLPKQAAYWAGYKVGRMHMAAKIYGKAIVGRGYLMSKKQVRDLANPTMPDKQTTEERVDREMMLRTENNPMLRSCEAQRNTYRTIAVELQSRLDKIAEVAESLRVLSEPLIENPAINTGAIQILTLAKGNQ